MQGWKVVGINVKNGDATPKWVTFPDVEAGKYVPLGALLARVRALRGLSQVVVADRAGMKAQTVSAIERGIYGIERVPMILRLADALDIPRVQLFEWSARHVETASSRYAKYASARPERARPRS
ncbi:hypothetical protein DL991_07585 [Amycolatopsis sp. WAC 01375]|nr:hypothetical protein DL991_07585 [Amycolatopsis sp. WAC 01375]